MKDLTESLAGDPLLVDPTSDLEGIYREHGPRLWRAILLYSGDPEIASDAVAEAFAQAIRRGHGIRSPASWVTRAAYKIAAGELKLRGGRYPIVEQPYEMPEPAFDLAAALAQLSPKQRAAAILHFSDGYSAGEVAELIGSTNAAVRVHLFRARKRLQDLLGDDDG